MNALNRVAQINIARQTTTVPRAAFGIPGIHGEFATTKTTTPFTRIRSYTSTTEMLNDGWTINDQIYNSAAAIFAQNPRPEKVYIGRKDSADADWTTALNAIQIEDDGWYTFSIIPSVTQLVFGADFAYGDIIDLVVGGVDVTNIELTDSSASIAQTTVLNLIKTQIELETTGITVTLDSGDTNNRTLLIAADEGEAPIVTGTVSPGVKVVFDTDFVTSNSIVFTVNSTAVTAVPFNTDQSTTMSDIETQIETDISGSIVTVDSGDVNNRTIFISVPTGVVTASAVVTGGASQPVATPTGGTPVTSVTITTDDSEYREVADWVETQKKIFFVDSNDTEILSGSDTTSIAYYVNNQNYDRTAVQYHPTLTEYFSSAWNGLMLPKDAGTATWFGKTPSGLASYTLTSSEISAAHGKEANTFSVIAGSGRTEKGTVGSGEYIDIIRGIDALESRIQEDIANLIFTQDKVPYTDDGIVSVQNVLRGSLEAFTGPSALLVLESIEITVPKSTDVDAADKTARTLRDVKFTATLQGAIHKVIIDGTVTI